MSIVVPPDAAPAAAAPPSPKPARRPLSKRAMHVTRRAHLYLGLFLFPWAVLYGVTAFLFNHPSAFSDQPTVTFGKDALVGTPLEALPSPAELAEQAVRKLNEMQQPKTPYTLAGEAKFGREFAFATVKADGRSLSLLFDLKAGGGTVRSTATVERKEPERAPFAVGPVGPAGPGGGRGGRGGPGGGGRPGMGRPEGSAGLKLDDPIHEKVKAAIPTVLERTGFPTGEITVTSVPDVVFPITADDRTWTATVNPMTGSVSGTPADAKPETELSWRRFLLRLHTAHGYPGEPNARWFWAVIVDVMAGVMCFWGVSGLLMWWQLKGTRRAGAVVLVLSAIAATALGFAMHAAMAG